MTENGDPYENAIKVPHAYLSIPVTLLGRFAVDISYQNQGLGGKLLIDALKRAWHAARVVGSMAVVVDPIDENAQLFYHKYGFILLPDSGKMFLPMQVIEKLF